jgi:hypothetical protein
MSESKEPLKDVDATSQKCVVTWRSFLCRVGIHDWRYVSEDDRVKPFGSMVVIQECSRCKRGRLDFDSFAGGYTITAPSVEMLHGPST